MSSQPSFATITPASDAPINLAWIEAATRERLWHNVHTAALAILFLAVLTWPKNGSNTVIEALLCVAIAVASRRYGRASRARARLCAVPEPSPRAVVAPAPAPAPAPVPVPAPAPPA